MANLTFVKNEQPLLTVKSMQYLSGELLKPTTRLLEFGSGGSTLWFARQVSHVDSIEHKKSWYTIVKGQLETKGITNVTQHLLQEGICRKQAYKNVVETLTGLYDIILIDGRNRCWCIYNTIPLLKGGGWIIFDNYTRKKYQKGIKQMLGDWHVVYYNEEGWSGGGTAIFQKP